VTTVRCRHIRLATPVPWWLETPTAHLRRMVMAVLCRRNSPRASRDSRESARRGVSPIPLPVCRHLCTPPPTAASLLSSYFCTSAPTSRRDIFNVDVPELEIRTSSDRDHPMCVNFRFRLYAFYKPTQVPGKYLFIYNSMLNLIPVSFCTAYIFVTFRVRVGVRVRVSFLGLGLGLG